MKDYRIILFDLDGTLTDPNREMINSATYALKHFGISQPEAQRLNRVVDTPLLQYFEQVFGLTPQQANQAFEHYWHYAGSLGLQQNRPYDGVADLLEELHRRGKTLCIATARQTRNAHQILKACQLDRFFHSHMGVDDTLSRQTKKMVIFDLLCDLGEYEDDEVVMIGDRPSDIQGARDNGIDSIGVTWGQEPSETVAGAQPTYIVHSVQELSELLLK